MTDNQKRLFQRILEGKIRVFFEDVFIDYIDHRDGYSKIVTISNKDHSDYAAAWEAYQNLPLNKALK